MTNTRTTTTTRKTNHYFRVVLAALAGTTLFHNPCPIQIADNSPANPYPSQTNVQNLSGNVTDVNLALYGYGHAFPDDVAVLLVGPQGQKALLMSDVGGRLPVNGVNVGFDDESSLSLPNEGQITDGFYKPTRGTAAGAPVAPMSPAPAPAGPYAKDLSVFDGTNPNGSWDLYFIDDTAGDEAQVAGGWDLFITTDAPPDTTSPRVTSTSPATGATGISPTANVGATFSEEMTGSTINATTFKLFKKGSTTKVAATVSYDAASDTATLDSTNSLRRGTTYKAVTVPWAGLGFLVD
jgi:hypothetical protein